MTMLCFRVFDSPALFFTTLHFPKMLLDVNYREHVSTCLSQFLAEAETGEETSDPALSQGSLPAMHSGLWRLERDFPMQV